MRSLKRADRLRMLRSALQERLRSRYPVLTRHLARRSYDPLAILLGRGAKSEPVTLPERVRLEHAFVVGTTGGGKSKFLELCIRQDIAAGRGVLVIDPHGEHPDSLYRSVLSWMKARGYLDRRQVHLIDPSAVSHTVGFNPLARPDGTDLSVIAGLTLEAFSRAWGGEDTSRRPTIERVLTTAFAALCELNLSLVEAPLLLDRADSHGLRRHAIETVRDAYTRRDLERLHELSNDDRRRQDFDLEVLGPVNRLARFLRPAATASMIGQTAASLDFRQAFDEGHIILCNLSGSERIYETDADLLGRLITRFAFHAARRRRNPERPFFLYMDECHRYLSGDLENILAESRKYGLGVLLATQWLQQLRKESENMLAAVLNATNTKVVFRVKDPKEAEQLAEMVIPFNLEIPVAALTKPTVIGYRRIRLANESDSEQHSSSTSRTDSWDESETHTISEGGSQSTTETESTGTSDSDAETTGDSTSKQQSSGWAAGRSDNEDLDPNFGFLGPRVIGMSRGTNGSENGSRSTGSSANRAHTRTRSQNSGFSRATSESDNWSESVAHSTRRGVSLGTSETHGNGRSRGSAEALEAILKDMPSAVHSRDNVRYMAARLARSLPTGRALVNYVGAGGMVSSYLKVPLVADRKMTVQAFDALRTEALSRSAWALPSSEAAKRIAGRAQELLAITRPIEPEEPVSFRSKTPLVAPGQARSRPAAAGRGRSRRSSKPKPVE